MPRATYSDEKEKYDLTSLPGAFVELRRLSYGERLHRRDLGMKFKSGQGRDVDVSLDSVRSTVFDFSKAITDHNLEDAEGNKLDLTNEKAIMSLDPRIAEEIDSLITQMNGLNEEPFQSGISSGA